MARAIVNRSTAPHQKRGLIPNDVEAVWQRLLNHKPITAKQFAHVAKWAYSAMPAENQGAAFIDLCLHVASPEQARRAPLPTVSKLPVFTQGGRKLAVDMLREIKKDWAEYDFKDVPDAKIGEAMMSREPKVMRRYLATVQKVGGAMERDFLGLITDFLGGNLQEYEDEHLNRRLGKGGS